MDWENFGGNFLIVISTIFFLFFGGGGCGEGGQRLTKRIKINNLSIAVYC